MSSSTHTSAMTVTEDEDGRELAIVTIHGRSEASGQAPEVTVSIEPEADAVRFHVTPGGAELSLADAHRLARAILEGRRSADPEDYRIVPLAPED